MKMTSIYALHDPACLGGRIRYVGEADNVVKHLGGARNGEKSHKANWIRSLFAWDLEPDFETLEEVPFFVWQCVERAYISWFRATGAPLTNICDGGEGISSGHVFSSETRAKMSAAAKERKFSEETRAKMSASMMGNTNAKGNTNRRGHKCSLETCKKMSAFKRGNTNSKGHTITDETRSKMSASQMGNTNASGRKHSESDTP
jgi:hypothetical protein